MNYSVISPIKNEENFIRLTIQSILCQKHRPLQWIIVDDGSTDSTAEIVKELTNNISWIKLVKNPHASIQRFSGSNVVIAFNAGLAHLTDESNDIIVKLDGDLSFGPEYFLNVCDEFIKDEQLGLCGGYVVEERNSVWINEIENDYHVRGAFKAYRRKCFDEIGGLMAIYGWDGIDEMKALYTGWKTLVIDMPVKHYRPTNSNYKKVKLAKTDAYYYYTIRTSIPLLFVRSITRLKWKPYGWCSLVFIYEFVYQFWKKTPYIVDRDLGKFINQFHYKRILKILK